MPIRIEHGRPETLVKAAIQAGKARAAIRAQERAERFQAQQQELEYRQALRQQDMVIDLQMNERAKMWEMEKMELRSRLDFQREEQKRIRKLDNIDNVLQQIDKEVEAGKITEEDAYPYRFKFMLEREGIDAPVSLLPKTDEARFGIAPYWMAGKTAPVGSPERALYDAKIKDILSGEKVGTVPYYLDKNWLSRNRFIAQQVLDSHNIFLSEDEIDDYIAGEAVIPTPAPTETPLEEVMPKVLPEPKTKEDWAALSVGTRYRAPDGTIRIK